jgi:hypothetical protein
MWMMKLESHMENQLQEKMKTNVVDLKDHEKIDYVLMALKHPH